MDANDWNKFWLERWSTGQIGFHQEQVEAFLNELFPKLTPTRIFVPFCGKSKDMHHFMQLGHEVIGVDLSELACQAFFEENKIAYQTISIPYFKIYKGKGITLYVGDFFKSSPAMFHGVELVYDRAALIALPQKFREGYSKHLSKVVPRPIQIFQIALSYDQTRRNGPPFSVPPEEIRTLYGEEFRIQELGSEEFIMPSRTQNMTQTLSSTERVYLMKSIR